MPRHPLLLPLCLLNALSRGFAAPGDVDPSFVASATVSSGNPIYTVVSEPTGGIYIGGGFQSLNGVSRSYFARLLENGSTDTGFNPQVNWPVRSTGSSGDGSIVAAGEFLSAGGTPRNRIARFSSTGTLDAGFNPNADGFLNGLTLQPDGRYLICGLFTSVSGQIRNRGARILSNGTLDTGFNPNANANIRAMALQPDGRVVLAGGFTSVGGLARNYLARVLGNGSVDGTFTPAADGEVYCLALQADGKILAGGNFTTISGTARTRLARLSADGSVDAGINLAVDGIVRWVIPQTDGRILFGGEFTSVGGVTRNRIARLMANGSLDTTFNPNANEKVFGASMYADGRLLIGGNFTSVGGITRNSLARLLNDTATQSLTVPSPGRVQWNRGGASPEITRAAFELSTNGGGTWSSLGAGTRSGGGWMLEGLTLPMAGLIRARAPSTGGYGNGSVGRLETSVAFSFSALEVWRQVQFGTAANTGIAANNADPDNDGLENLVEFAFGRSPSVPDAAALPQWVVGDEDFRLAFTKPAGVDGITYLAEYSTSMAPGSWSAAVNSGTAAQPVFIAPAITQRLYMRVRVTAP